MRLCPSCRAAIVEALREAAANRKAVYRAGADPWARLQARTYDQAANRLSIGDPVEYPLSAEDHAAVALKARRAKWRRSARRRASQLDLLAGVAP